MSRIDELIAEHCPDGVPFRMLDDLFESRNGYTPSKSVDAYWAEGRVPWFRMEDIRANGRILGASMQQISESAVKGGRLFPANSLIVATSATIGEHALVTVPHLCNQRFTSLTLKPSVADLFEVKFLYYYCFVLDDWCKNNTTTSSFSSVDMSGFRQFRFPVPPLEVQREIVRILDTFTALEAELEAELEARRRQYAHYRVALLDSEENASVAWAPLGSIAVNHDARRRPVTKAARAAGEIPYYGASGVVDWVSDYIFEGDYLLVSEDGANLLARSTPIAFSISGRAWVNNHAHVLEFASYAERRFVEIYLNSIDLSPFVTGAAQPKLNQANLNRIPIPTPPVSEQARVVANLDKFETLLSDISVGLPAELAARRKQYEYYRDRLLSFAELSA